MSEKVIVRQMVTRTVRVKVEGPPGPAGPAGVDGLGFDWAGPWDNAETYDAGQVVSYEGSSWIATEETAAGDAPGVSSVWEVVAAEGDTGPTGATGPPGAAGATGAAGGQGPEGPQGQTGPEGPEGPQGPDGADGAPGAPGADGEDGAPGAPGADGEDGAPGAPGADGVGVPDGGTTGQVLAKASAEDFDTEWIDPPEGGGGGGTTDGTLSFLLIGA